MKRYRLECQCPGCYWHAEADSFMQADNLREEHETVEDGKDHNVWLIDRRKDADRKWREKAHA
jgi:hypothetical protein